MTDLPLSSISASGLVDGLGRRLLAFDRETGVMLERLVLRPELAAFEAAIKQRVDLLAAIDDERFARPGTVQRDGETGDLAVVSEFVAGSRLSDIIETAEEAGLVPGVDVALGFLLEALPAISTFHNVTGFAHGLIEPSRMVITSGAGQVVFLDPSFGSVIERLGLSRHRLWAELGIAAASSPGPVRLDAATDTSQLVLSALMLVIGRRLGEHEYPDALPSLLNEVLEVAQIRGSNLFATSLDRLFQRSLPVASRKPFGSADELANEIRLLLRREIGVDVCRQALLDFVEQMDAASEQHEEYTDSHAGNGGGRGFGLDDQVLDSMSFEVLDDGGGESDNTFEEDSEDEEYSEVSLDPEQFTEPVTEPESHREPALDEFPSLESTTDHVSAASDVIGSDAESIDELDSASEASSMEEVEAAEAIETAAEAESDNPAASRRRKRQNKSARARKDKLRSSAKPQPAPEPPPKPQPQAEQKPATPSGWLVSPDRAAAFAPPVPEAPRPQAPAAMAPPVVTPTQPAFTPVPTPIAAPPIARPVPMPVYTPGQTTPAPAVIQPPAPAAPLPQIRQQPAAAGPVRLKNDLPAGYAPPRVSEPIAPMPSYAQRSVFQQPEEEAPSRFPWKLAAAALVFVAIAVVAGRAYMLTGKKDGETDTASTTIAAPVNPLPPTPSRVETGDVTVETQPSGARVLLDGKPVGTSPLKLAGVPVGRHMLTFASSSGEVTRTIKVAAGKTLEVDVPIFSGWLAVFAPIVLDISVNGKSIGTTEQSRLMISPGRHELTLSNKDFGYKSVQEVSVEPGEVRSLTIDPRGDANFNAIPWAEVWMDGQKLGDTPMANMRVPLGTREFVFKHPQYGERRITAIIRADQPTPVSVDFTKSQHP